MSMIARHKKTGGFRKLVNSLETTAVHKRNKILEVMKLEDPEFIADVEGSIFTFNEFSNVSDPVICEIVDCIKTELRTLAFALYDSSQSGLAEKFTRNMGPSTYRAYREEVDSIEQPSLGNIITAQFRIITKVRALENEGKFVIKKYLGNYGI